MSDIEEDLNNDFIMSIKNGDVENFNDIFNKMDFNILNRSELSKPMMIAAKYDQLEIYKTLEDKNKELMGEPLVKSYHLYPQQEDSFYMAVEFQSEKIINHLKNDALIEATFSKNTDKSELFKIALENEADVSFQDSDGRTALMYASMKGHSEFVETLIDKGANVNTLDNYGDTALIHTTYNNNLDIAETLIKHNADVNVKNQDGESALIIALNKGLDTDFTPLNYESSNEYHGVIKALIDNKADINVKNEMGDSALILASKNGYNDIVKTMLVDHQAKVSDEDKKTLNDLGATFTLDLIDKRDLQNQLLNETRQIPEIQTKKKSLTMKL